MEDVKVSQDDMNAINAYIQKHPLELFKIPNVCAMLSARRIQSLKRDNINGYEGDTSRLRNHIIEYNKDGIMGMWALNRPSLLIWPLVSIDYLRMQMPSIQVLSIGPRAEAELFMLVSIGFNIRNIKALDLVSYSPSVDVGDMHDMPYEENSFDVIILGWVIAYSNDHLKVAQEVMRVAKPGAVVAIGCEYNPNPAAQEDAKSSVKIDNPLDENEVDPNYYLWTTKRIHDLFGDRIDRIYFNHDVHEKFKHLAGGCISIFSLK